MSMCLHCGGPLVEKIYGPSPNVRYTPKYYCSRACQQPDPLIQFMRKVLVTDHCWYWTGSKNEHGYGGFRIDGRLWKAHQWLFERLETKVPVGLVLDHKVCKRPDCVRPSHLEPVTQRENLFRARKRFCWRGHDLENPANYKLRERPGAIPYKRCIACQHIYERNRIYQEKAA